MDMSMSIVLPTTLALAAAAAITNIWLSIRIGALRQKHKVSVGDGGNEAIQRRMRAQLNFAENTFLVLVLVAAIELSGYGSWWLPLVAFAYAVGRILHGLGMDVGTLQWGRMVGTLVTMLTQLGLAGVAAWLAFQFS